MTKLNEVRLHAKPVNCDVCMGKNCRKMSMLALLLEDHLKEEACMKYINAKISFPMRWSRNCKAIFKGATFMFPPIKRNKTVGRSVWLPTGIAATKPPNRRGVPERNLYGGVSGKIFPVRIRLFVKSSIRNELAGVAEMQPLLFVVYRLIRYCPVDRKEAMAVVRY